MNVLRQYGWQFALGLTVAATMGVVGGVIGHFWAHGFTLDKDDKFDIFVSLLAVIGVVAGIAFGGAGAVLYTWFQRRLSTASEELLKRAQAGIERNRFMLDSYVAIVMWDLSNISMLSGAVQEQNLNRLALIYAENANRFVETWQTGMGEADTPQVMENISTLVWLYAYFERADQRDYAYRLARDLQGYIEGREEDEWQMAETSNYLRYKLPRTDIERDDAQSYAKELVRRNDIDELTKQAIMRNYDLSPEA